jgi:arginase family enzyme
LGLTTLLVLFDILFMAYKIAPGKFTPPPGGLDGCLVTTAAERTLRQQYLWVLFRRS